MIEHPGERIVDIDIEREMRKAYLDYAMSVIVERALPDVRDGLKPVQRRILWTMHEMGLAANRPTRKSAAIVGDVMGKYHPHGDAPIYDALVRLAQPFSMRYPLIIGQGNFGSIDDDPPAHMRYCVAADTLVRLPDATARMGDLVPEAEPSSETDVDLTVLGARGEPVRASKFFHSGTHPTYTLRTREGYSLTGTANHPVLTARSAGEVPLLGWTLLGDVREGDRVVLLRRPPAELGVLDPQDERLARLAAAMVSDGRASERRAGSDDEDPDRDDAACDAVAVGRRSTSATIRSGDAIHEVDVRQRGSFRAAPLAETIGRRGAEERVPSFVWRRGPAFKRAFLRSLFERDGSPPVLAERSIRMACSTRSGRLASEVQQLLLELGVVSKLRHDDAGETEVVVSDRREARLFAKHVGSHGREQRELETELARGAGIRPRLPGAAARETGDPSVDGTYYFAEVASVAYDGMAPVFSVRVDTDEHAFITNGFVSHNTEAKLSAVSAELLADIEKETADFVPNYDGRHQQPTVMPTKLPNLIVNGSAGIAVGMATNIPPHNLGEVTAAIKRLIEDPDLTADDIAETVLGPDFPGGGVIYRFEEQKNVETGKLERIDVIRRAYANGRGRIVVRARAHFEEIKGNRQAIVVDELPYTVNKAALIEKIADLVNDKRIADISDIRDESDRDGMRVVIEIKRDGDSRKVLNNLYKHTAMQSAFNVNMLALVDNQPRTLSLKDVLVHFIEHRRTVIKRRTEYDLTRAKERAHILEGFKIAIANLDDVVRTIRQSKTPETAHQNLRERFKLSDAQAKAILEMQLRRLTSLERQKIEEEYAETIKLIAELESILASPRRVLHLVSSELDDVAKKYGDERRTKILDDVVREMTDEDLVADEDVVVTISSRNYIKRVPLSTFKQQHRGGRGVTGMAMRDEDDVQHLLVARTHDRVYFFTDRGRVFATKVFELPDASRTGKGIPLQNILEAMAPGERVGAIVPLRDGSNMDYLVMATRKGFVKKTALKEYGNVRRAGLIAIALRKGDELAWAGACKKNDLIVLATKKGKGICFKESDARPMGRDTQGVTGIRLAKGDEVIGMGVARAGMQVLSVTGNGFGKRTAIEDFPVQGRAGSGVILASLSPKTGDVASVEMVDPTMQEVIVITRTGIVIRVPLEQVKVLGRATMGVKVMATGEAKIASVEVFAPTRPQQGQLALA